MLRKSIYFSLIALVFTKGFDNLKMYKLEESSIMFPETNFKTYERPELEKRDIIDENNNELELVQIGKRRVLYKRNNLNVTEIAKQFMEQNYPNIDYVYQSILDFDDESDIASVHLAQAINGEEIANTAININIDKLSGGIISSGVSVWENIKPNINSAVDSQTMDVTEAIVIASENLELTNEPIDVNNLTVDKLFGNYYKVKGVPFSHDGTLKARKLYTGVSQSKAERVWELTVEIDIDYVLIVVSIDSRAVIQLQNLTHHIAYKVVPFNRPNIGNTSRVTYNDPFLENFSPLGWHQDISNTYHDTRGNNVRLAENRDGNDSIEENTYISSDSNGNYEFKYDGNTNKIEGNQKAAAANVFYLTNMLHDMFFKLGFTEGYGNFQTNNFSGRGKDNDPVLVFISDRGGKNNAQMSVSVDGISPKLRLYPFNVIDGPERDPSFDNEIITHEFTHGVSNRLTGGPNTIQCLTEEEANCLNEGWSDFFANAFQFRNDRDRNTPFYLFRYVLDEKHGRKYPITSDTSLNPLTYADLSYNKNNQKKIDLYTGCEVWSVMLHEVFWNVVEVYRNDPDFFLKEKQNLTYAPSNFIVMKMIIDGMKLQPCQPTFITARDSILSALDNFNGTNTKLICCFWLGFAKRGLGINATGRREKGSKVIYTNDFTIPEECNKYNILG
ncbi:hypothetical protein H8356DRAFT_1653112 [Neocallimastix lanati (nom. inval.)]|jgi:extracellular elastinolytic metalloproteinase|uniref:Extracellular metalloproteinase n=1 Tax=Neocallimastix californiae TaxID=1754190 RepID=A0A1Y2F358_9FUNG|nr:hypothetical protein H8356DRAFT_1653112 [Neocallimastix sp. JGI-2020a]ORY77914.1 hypothetical protein LY90DRAFT_84946 [Neocallimastix californiae]|eukprot:ORY77914.1 hypothetical protein LY90DRAFT_84946 [Neocallimastix californiae]